MDGEQRPRGRMKVARVCAAAPSLAHAAPADDAQAHGAPSCRGVCVCVNSQFECFCLNFS